MLSYTKGCRFSESAFSQRRALFLNFSSANAAQDKKRGKWWGKPLRNCSPGRQSVTHVPSPPHFRRWTALRSGGTRQFPGRRHPGYDVTNPVPSPLDLTRWARGWLGWKYVLTAAVPPIVGGTHRKVYYWEASYGSWRNGRTICWSEEVIAVMH